MSKILQGSRHLINANVVFFAGGEHLFSFLVYPLLLGEDRQNRLQICQFIFYVIFSFSATEPRTKLLK